MNAGPHHRHAAPGSTGGRFTLLRRFALGMHGVVLVAAIGAWVWISITFMRSASKREPTPAPTAMESVDWCSPESSAFCLACHRTIGPAMAGLDVDHGHPINVPLTGEQVAAVGELGTIAGPGDTLICMSCHVLTSDKPFMLADTLEDSRLCEHCHAAQFVLNGARHDFRQTAPEIQNRLGQRLSDAGPCGICHTVHTYAQEFKPCELDPNGWCVACHQMPRCSDDLTRMMLDHPESHCTECHSPHHNDHGYYLKRPLMESCLDCHAGYGGGPAAGMHPLGAIERPIPPALLEAGAKAGKNPFELTCLVCHSAHAANHAPLLLYEPRQDSLCLACHEEELLARTCDGTLPRHGQRPELNADQQAAVRAWGGRIGPGNELLCVSCHMVHDSFPNASLLAFSVRSDDSCTMCHPDQAGVIGSAHDLRTNRPDEKNLLGVSVVQGGACSACHLGHGGARSPVPAPGDPAGVCTTCHQPGACAQDRLVGGVSHPETACTDCHDPHARTPRQFLAKPTPELCSDCHAAQFSIVGGPHDRRTDPSRWPQAAQGSTDLCMTCHVAHGGERPDLHRFGSTTRDSYHDDACLTCHADAGWNADSSTAIIHPHEISPDQHQVALALVPKDDQGRMRMGCRTCHDPHGGREPVHLARVRADEPTENLCLRCHNHGHILLSGHSSERLAGLGRDVDSCKPCHAMHAERDGAWGQMLSPRFLLDDCTAGGEENTGCVPCLSCHHAGGPAPLRDVFTHPTVVLTDIIDRSDPGFMPLFNAAGNVDLQGQVTCRTCHLAHGWVPPGTSAEAMLESLTPEQQRSRRFSLRPFEAPNVCTKCHGPEARWRFLFFHDPARRKGPAASGAEK